jgi:hypothetical protein
MIVTATTMEEILRSSGGLIISTKGLSPDTMLDLARAAAAGKARLTFRVTAALTPDTMIQVARAGNGHATFDVTE